MNYEEPNHAPFLCAHKYDLKTNTYKEQIWRGSDDIHDDDGKFYGGEGILYLASTAEDRKHVTLTTQI